MFTSTKERFGLGRIFQDATEEALRTGDRRVGTEHVLVALLMDGDSVAARALGTDVDQARDGLRELDRRALLVVGLNGPPPGSALTRRRRERLRLTPAAKELFKGTRAKTHGDRFGVRHILLLLLGLRSPDPAAELLDHLGIDREQARERLQAAR
jgi:ATP-dependent Clp protease ATP-binding subunit ClpA